MAGERHWGASWGQNSPRARLRPAPRKKAPKSGSGSKGPWWLWTLVALLVLVVIGTASRDAEKEPGPAPTVTVTQTQTTELPAVVATETVTEGSVEDDTGIEEESAAPEPEATQPSEDVYYDNCDEARAAGDAPLYAGDPGYSAHLDRDGDGVACEPYAGP